jgi:putative ABC transport system permease protein
MRAHAWWIAALLRLYPRGYRERHAAELASAMHACINRERQRGVNRGLTTARLVLDAVSASVLVRRDIRRSERVSDLSPKDSLMQSILYDLRYSLRLIARAPLFSVLVIVTLALAIGANTAIFSVVNGVLLRSLPFESPDRLVLMYKGVVAQQMLGFSAPDFVAFRERARGYQGVAAYRTVDFELSGVATPERIKVARISASLLDVLGVQPALGRAFTSEEDAGRQPVAILSDALWRRSFGADPSVIGRPVILDRRAYTIVGVMPAHAPFPYRGPRLNNEPAAVFVPISFSDFELRAFGSMYNNTVVARLKDGVTMEQARAEAAEISRQVGAEVYPAELRELGSGLTTSLTPMQDEIVGNVRRLLYVLLAAVGVVLLIACADIACLMLTRVAGRERELAIRTALGAGRGRVMRLVLMETGVLATVGTAIGVALAWWGQRALLASAPVEIPRAQEIAFDVRVLGFTVAVSIAAALITGLLPAWEASRRDSNAALKEGGRTGGVGGIRQQRVFAGLVTLQFAGAVVLLAAGGLLMRSFVRLMTVDPGFKSDNVVSASTSLPARSYRTGTDVRQFYGRLLESARQLPGVTAVGAGTDLPLTVRERRAFTVENPPAATATLPHVVANDWVMGQYFEALGVRIVSGRPLSDADTLQSEPVVVVNETLARRFWPGEDPIGRRLAWGLPTNHGPWMRVVGVIGDIKQTGLAVPTEPQTWQPWAQVSDQMLGGNVVGIFRSMRLMVRSQVPPETLISAIREQVRALDPALPVTDVQTLDDVVAASAAPQRFNAALLGGFAGIALLLAAVGIGGVLAITVSRRTQEIGVRLALGADAASVVRMVIRQAMTLVAAGLAIGLPIALAATRMLTSLLFETTSHDVVTFAGATVVLCLVASAACTAPAVRASRVDPMRALRID